MINIKTLVICILSVFVLSGGNFIHKADVFAQVITDSEEESDVYMQLSDILDYTKKELDDATQAINAGEKDNALNILANITSNIKEIENGLNLLVDNPIHGGD